MKIKFFTQLDLEVHIDNKLTFAQHCQIKANCILGYIGHTSTQIFFSPFPKLSYLLISGNFMWFKRLVGRVGVRVRVGFRFATFRDRVIITVENKLKLSSAYLTLNSQ